jgi:cytidylate kinase
VSRVAGAEQVEEAKAARTIKDSDAGRRDYLKRFYSVDSESPCDYDLVINTDVLSAEQAAEIILRAADR